MHEFVITPREVGLEKYLLLLLLLFCDVLVKDFCSLVLKSKQIKIDSDGCCKDPKENEDDFSCALSFVKYWSVVSNTS